MDCRLKERKLITFSSIHLFLALAPSAHYVLTTSICRHMCEMYLAKV